MSTPSETVVPQSSAPLPQRIQVGMTFGASASVWQDGCLSRSQTRLATTGLIR